MKFKKLSAFLIAASLAATALAGCGSSSSSSSGSSSSAAGEGSSSKANGGEVVNLTAIFPGTESSGAAAVTKAVNEKLVADGLNINVTVKFADDYWNKLALDTAGGTVYDIAWAHASTLSDLVAKKVYQPIDEAFAQNGADLKANTPDYILKGGMVNGKLYAFPRVIPMTDFASTFDIRGDLREKYNIEPITTVEGMEKYLEAIVKNEKDMIPMCAVNFNQFMPVYANYFYPIGDGSARPIYVDPADNKVYSTVGSEGFTKAYTKIKEWRDKGYIAADTTKVESPDTGFDYGQVAAVPSNAMRASERIDTFLGNVPDGKVETVKFTPEVSRIFLAGDNMLAVPSSSKNPNEAVAFINWIKKDQANYDLWSYGVEGVNYKLADGAVDVSATADADKYNMNTWMWNDIRLARFSAKYPKSDIEMLKNWDKDSEVTKFVGFVYDQSKTKAQVSQIGVVMDEYMENLGKGVIDINKVNDEFKKKLDAAGLQDLIAEAQTQIDAWIAAQ